MSNEPVFITSLGSGSSGNAFVIEYGDDAIIVDQGFSRKELIARMKQQQLDPERLCGALLTHEHSDHSKGSRVFCDALQLPLYTTTNTALYLQRAGKLPARTHTFEAGAEFSVGPFAIRSFSLPHDAVDPVGFTISCGSVRIGIATDLGRAAENVRRALRQCDALVLESNYDRQMLMNSDRRLELKRRICGVRGHLGNTDTAELLQDLLCERSRLLLLGHISRECNCHQLVRECCINAIQKIAPPALQIDILEQDAPSSRFMIAGIIEGELF